MDGTMRACCCKTKATYSIKRQKGTWIRNTNQNHMQWTGYTHSGLCNPHQRTKLSHPPCWFPDHCPHHNNSRIKEPLKNEARGREEHLSGRNRTVTVTFSFDLAKSGRSSSWDGRGGLTGESLEECCAGRATLDTDEGVVGREEVDEEGVVGRAPGLCAVGGAGLLLDRKGEMLDRSDLDAIVDGSTVIELRKPVSSRVLGRGSKVLVRRGGGKSPRARSHAPCRRWVCFLQFWVPFKRPLKYSEWSR